MCKTEFDNKRKTGRTKTASADKKVIGGGAERKVPHHAGAGRSVQYQWEHFVKIFYVSSLAAEAVQWRGWGGVAVCAGVRSDAGWAVLAGPQCPLLSGAECPDHCFSQGRTGEGPGDSTGDQ